MSAGSNRGLIRWPMLAIICLGCFAPTLNWFDDSLPVRLVRALGGSS